MSDTAFVPGQMRVAEPEKVEETDPTSRRGLLLLAVVAALAVVGIVAWLLFFSGSSEPTAVTESPSVPAPAAQPAVPAPSPSSVAANPNSSNRSKHGFRDPFKALIAPAVSDTGTAVAAGTTGTAAAATGSTAATTGTSAGTSGTTAAAGAGTPAGTAAPNSSAAHSLKVVSVAGNNSTITVKVDGKTYKNLKAGQVFAKFFKVIGIGGQVNVIQFGDEKFNISGTKAVTLAS
jgi:hypothetical protein